MESYDNAYDEMVDSVMRGNLWVAYVFAPDVIQTWVWMLNPASLRAAVHPRYETRVLFMLELIKRGRVEQRQDA